MEKVFCLFGPTASGKTNIAIELVKRYPFEIISVDSAMVYKGMDIGTAKPTKEELAIAPHRLINICDPAENYSAGQFCQDVKWEITEILAANKIPLLVGGTMLYFNLLQKGFDQFPESDAKVREAIDLEAKQQGWQAMHTKLAEIDPQTAKKIHPNDTQRIQRALELIQLTGKSVSELQKKQQWKIPSYEFINLCLLPEDRKQIHQKIEQRFDGMLAAGFIAEVEKLFQRSDLSINKPAIRLVGYRQVWNYLAGEYDYQQMRLKAIYATRQFAKRQYTWMRSWQNKLIFSTTEKLLQHCEFSSSKFQK